MSGWKLEDAYPGRQLRWALVCTKKKSSRWLISESPEHATRACSIPMMLSCLACSGGAFEVAMSSQQSFVFARWPIRVPVFTRNCALFFWFPCGFIINTYYTVWSQFDTQLEYAERVDRIGTSSSAIPAAWLRGFCFKMVLDSSICHTNGAFWHCHGWTGRRDARAYENDMKRVELHRILASSM